MGDALVLGVTHRDLRPSNIVILRGTGEVKVKGFGIWTVKESAVHMLSCSKSLIRPPGGLAGGHLSPEQADEVLLLNRQMEEIVGRPF